MADIKLKGHFNIFPETSCSNNKRGAMVRYNLKVITLSEILKLYYQ